jgi:hypothetical protein
VGLSLVGVSDHGDSLVIRPRYLPNLTEDGIDLGLVLPLMRLANASISSHSIGQNSHIVTSAMSSMASSGLISTMSLRSSCSCQYAYGRHALKLKVDVDVASKEMEFWVLLPMEQNMAPVPDRFPL